MHTQRSSVDVAGRHHTDTRTNRSETTSLAAPPMVMMIAMMMMTTTTPSQSQTDVMFHPTLSHRRQCFVASVTAAG